MTRPLSDGEGHLLHFHDQLREHVKDLPDPEVFAQAFESASPEDQNDMLDDLLELQAAVTKLMMDIEEARRQRGND